MKISVDLFNYAAAIFLIFFGLYAMMTRLNLIQKIIGMSVLQTGTILFYITLSVKTRALIPIIGAHARHNGIDPAQYANPLPHALMLTAIVVGVATLGVALTLAVSLYRHFHSLEEDVILKQMESDS
ncbi:MAG: hypothetical protein A2Z83_00775 [Omnitrophica bacterium GWA2_52_8]|nr:MAG: hypothetical protein A2Z83_00775 [Omnitrophica bacterium GWA2_52_8]